MANYSFADVVKSVNNKQCSQFFKKVKVRTKCTFSQNIEWFFFIKKRISLMWLVARQKSWLFDSQDASNSLPHRPGGLPYCSAFPPFHPFSLPIHLSVRSIRYVCPSCLSVTSIWDVRPSPQSIMSVCHIHPSVTSVRLSCLSIMSVHHVCPSRLSVMLSVTFVHHVCPFSSVYLAKKLQFEL